MRLNWDTPFLPLLMVLLFVGCSPTDSGDGDSPQKNPLPRLPILTEIPTRLFKLAIRPGWPKI